MPVNSFIHNNPPDLTGARRHSMTPVFRSRGAAACRLVFASALAFAWAGQTQAQVFSAKPVRVIVGYAAGGGNDVIMRVVAQKFSEHLGQPVVIENKPGAASIIAAEFVAKSAPDGYTLLMGPSGPIVFSPAIYPKLSYSIYTSLVQ